MLGTSGYSYSDWKGGFYPEGLSQDDRLQYYSRTFNTVELNFTYYTHPGPHIFQGMTQKVGNGFIFSLKAHSCITHTRDCKEADIINYMNAIKPLADRGMLGTVLLQFPSAFRFSQNNLDYLKKLRQDFGELDLAVEFRHNSWIKGKVIDFMSGNNLGFCNVDQPGLKSLIPPTGICTTRTGYVRFHGRNAVNWWKPAKAYMRYDYLYSQEELAPWVPRIKKLRENTDKTFVYFNNHYKAQAVKSALILRKLIEDKGFDSSS
ncbi:MAG: DUF72 domain-containing protein [Actinobacteria bacterium]|nr:DUF72 domain-containing protein [Actinomycetota bacterium]